MAESKAPTGPTIAENLMLGRLAQSEQMREFFIQMWLQNPLLAKHVGKRIQELLTPTDVVANDGVSQVRQR